MFAGLVGAVFGLLLYVAVVHPLRRHGLLVQTIATLAAALVLRSLAQLVFGSQPYAVPPFTEGGPLHLGQAVVAYQTLWLLGLSIVLALGLKLLLDRSTTGRALSACAVNRYAAGVVGISVVRMAMIAFVISGALTGFIGAVGAPLTFASAAAGLGLSLKAFIAAVLGGFDRVGLAVVGGVLVGIVESFVASSISTAYQEVVVLVLLVVLLIVRPSGLTRLRVSERV